MNIIDDKLLTPHDVSTLTGLTERALSDRRRRRIEPAFIKLGAGPRGVRYRQSVVEEWLRRCEDATPQVGSGRPLDVPQAAAALTRLADGVEDDPRD